MTARSAIVLGLIAGLAACSQFPPLDESLSPGAKSAPYPDLVPVEDLRAQAAGLQIGDQTLSGIEARVARLKARAARLRGTVLSGADRARLAQVVQ